MAVEIPAAFVGQPLLAVLSWPDKTPEESQEWLSY
jgi:hypothetical protein